MATTQPTLVINIEESPRYEGAPTTTPYRVSTVPLYLPATAAVMNPGPSQLDRSDEIRGTLSAPIRLSETFEPSGRIATRAYVNHMAWLLHVCGFVGTPTAGNGVITDPDGSTIPVGVTRWVFTKRGGATAKSMQMQILRPFESVFEKGQGFGASGMTLNAAGELTMDLLGLVWSTIADPNVTPTYDSASIPPVRRGDLTLTWLANGATATDFSISIANPIARYYDLSLGSKFPGRLEHTGEPVLATGSITKNALDTDDIAALMAGTPTTFAAKARWDTGRQIAATGYNYKLWIEMPSCQLTGLDPDELSNRRRFSGRYDFIASYDEATGSDVKITLTSSVTAVETYV